VSRSATVLNCGAAPAPSMAPPTQDKNGTVHYDWHWTGDYGNGDPAQPGRPRNDKAARAPVEGHAHSVLRVGGGSATSTTETCQFPGQPLRYGHAKDDLRRPRLKTDTKGARSAEHLVGTTAWSFDRLRRRHLYDQGRQGSHPLRRGQDDQGSKEKFSATTSTTSKTS